MLGSTRVLMEAIIRAANELELGVAGYLEVFPALPDEKLGGQIERGRIWLAPLKEEAPDGE
jgi:hypothetical protein